MGSPDRLYALITWVMSGMHHWQGWRRGWCHGTGVIVNSGGNLCLVLAVSTVSDFCFLKHWVRLTVVLGLAQSWCFLQALALSSVN